MIRGLNFRGLPPALIVSLVLLAALLLPAGASGLRSFAILGYGACTGAGISALPSSPHQPSGTVVITGTASGACVGNAQFKFWIRPPGMAWGVVQDWSTSNTYNWPITGIALGTYGLEVDVRNDSYGNPYDAVANTTYDITPCASPTASVSGNPASPQTAGTQVILTASSTGCPTPRYQFWIEDAGATRWILVQDYSASTTYTWAAANNTTAGTYHLQVYVRDASENATYDAVSAITDYVMNMVPPCTAPGLSFAPPSPGPTGGTVVETGSSATCPNPRYRFWVFDAGGDHWSLVQDYSATTTHSWAGHGAAGVYKMEVDVRDASSTASYDAVFNTIYTVVGCSAAGLTAAPASPQPHGTPVVLTATSTCPGTASYRFWILDPGASHWSLVQDYSASNTYSWAAGSTMAVGTYGLEVDVRDVGGTASYEKVFNTTFTTT